MPERQRDQAAQQQITTNEQAVLARNSSNSGNSSNPKPNKELRPATLELSARPIEYTKWKDAFKAYFTTGDDMSGTPCKAQQYYLFNLLAAEVAEQLHPMITEATPVYSQATTVAAISWRNRLGLNLGPA